MTKFLSFPLAVSSLLILSACGGYISQESQEAPSGSISEPQVAQKKEMVPPIQREPEQKAPQVAEQPAQVQSQPEPAPKVRSYTAGVIQTYNATAYAQALADVKTVIIDFHANWCPICAANAPGIRAAFESTANANVVGFIADYDKEVALENQFGISSQSTLIKVRGSEPASAQKVGTLGPGPLTQQQVEAFIRS